MLAIHADPESLVELRECPPPSAGEGEVLVQVEATAINRADLLQLKGLYPPPEGESEIPGLECVGRIVEVGTGVEGEWRVGDRIAALLAGGGQAEIASVPEGQMIRVPDALPIEEAAALMESALTAWTNLVVEGGLVAGERVFVTGATGGVGTYAVTLARALGAEVVAISRPSSRLDELGRRLDCATAGIGAPTDWAPLEGTADLVLDFVGGEWLEPLLASLRPKGRLVLVGIMGGPKAEIELWRVLRKRLRVIGSVLRSRPRDEKARLVAGFHDFAAAKLAAGELRPIVAETFPFAEIDRAYARVLEGGVLGKVVVRFDI